MSATPAGTFREESARLAGDLEHRRRIAAAMGTYETARGPRQGAFLSWELGRQALADTKWEAVNRLDEHLERFEKEATAGTGQPLTCYNTFYGGPRQPGEADGPEEWHVILLDNHRTELLADPEQRDALHCIRCGACLNVCPVFRAIGGLSYGTTYQGPVGSVITPHLRGLQDWKHLSGASSLCGACTDTCPVKIDLHHHLLHNRRNAARERGGVERWVWKAFSFVMRRPFLYGMGMRVARLMRPLHAALLEGGVLDPVRAWTASRELPELAEETFRERWKRRGRE